MPNVHIRRTLALYHPGHANSVVAVNNGQLILFLSFYQVGSLSATLGRVFPLPANSVFSGHVI